MHHVTIISMNERYASTYSLLISENRDSICGSLYMNTCVKTHLPLHVERGSLTM